MTDRSKTRYTPTPEDRRRAPLRHRQGADVKGVWGTAAARMRNHLADLSSQAYDPDALAQRGLVFERLDQLAMEHLLGVRA